MNKHTPGPWVAIQKLCDPQEWRINTGPDPVLGHMRWEGMCEIKVYGCDDDPKNGACVAKANARLIAAAPDLLAALEKCAAVCAGDTTTKGGLIAALEAARTALAKAKGEA